jgi:hypothetical protein
MNMTAILRHNLDMPWESSPTRESLKLKKARLTPRPFTITPRSRRSTTVPQTVPAADSTAHRRIRTSPAVLRALREAEMAAWNKAVPDTTAPASALVATPVREARTEIATNNKAELRLFTVIATIAAVAVVEGFWGLSALLDRWSAFADFVQRTFTAN